CLARPPLLAFGGLGVRVSPPEAALGRGEALHRGLERALPPLAPRPQPLLLGEPLRRGQLKGQALYWLSRDVAVRQGEQRLLAYVTGLRQGALAQPARAPGAAGKACGQRQAA